jgi:hypothetical protein
LKTNTTAALLNKIVTAAKQDAALPGTKPLVVKNTTTEAVAAKIEALASKKENSYMVELEAKIVAKQETADKDVQQKPKRKAPEDAAEKPAPKVAKVAKT